jgi:putative ABC transport system permease protein
MSQSSQALPLTAAPAAREKNRTLAGWPVLGEALKMAAGAVWTHKLRSFLTLIGVIIGVASVMVVGAIISGLETYVTDNITSALGSNSFIIDRVARVNMTHEEYDKIYRKHKDLTWDDYQAILQKSKLAKAVVIQKGRRTDPRYKSRELFDTRVTGSSANIVEIASLDVISGRFFQSFEVDRAQAVTVIGWELRTALFPGEDPLGRLIKLGGQDYRVIGVLAKRGSFLGNNQDNEAYIPVTSFTKTFGTRRGWTIRVKTDAGPAFEQCQDEVRSILRAKHDLKPNQEDDFDILSTEAINQSVGQFTGAIASVAIPVMVIALVVGGIVIMNIMLVSVTERTREIGIRKAIGARRRDLLLQFLLESAIMGILGGSFGILLAFGCAFLIENLAGWTLTVTPFYIILSLTISGGVGILAGMYPAWKAAKLDPILALSFES